MDRINQSYFLIKHQSVKGAHFLYKRVYENHPTPKEHNSNTHWRRDDGARQGCAKNRESHTVESSTRQPSRIGPDRKYSVGLGIRLVRLNRFG